MSETESINSNNTNDIDEKDKFKTYRLKDSNIKRLIQLNDINKQQQTKVGSLVRQSTIRKSNNIEKPKSGALFSGLEKRRIETEAKLDKNSEARISQNSKTNIIEKMKVFEENFHSVVISKNKGDSVLENDDDTVSEVISLNIVSNQETPASPIITETDPNAILHPPSPNLPKSTVHTESKSALSNTLDYFKPKEKPSLQFSQDFLQSFVSRSTNPNSSENVLPRKRSSFIKSNSDFERKNSQFFDNFDFTCLAAIKLKQSNTEKSLEGFKHRSRTKSQKSESPTETDDTLANHQRTKSRSLDTQFLKSFIQNSTNLTEKPAEHNTAEPNDVEVTFNKKEICDGDSCCKEENTEKSINHCLSELKISDKAEEKPLKQAIRKSVFKNEIHSKKILERINNLRRNKLQSESKTGDIQRHSSELMIKGETVIDNKDFLLSRKVSEFSHLYAYKKQNFQTRDLDIIPEFLEARNKVSKLSLVLAQQQLTDIVAAEYVEDEETNPHMAYCQLTPNNADGSILNTHSVLEIELSEPLRQFEALPNATVKNDVHQILLNDAVTSQETVKQLYSERFQPVQQTEGNRKRIYESMLPLILNYVIDEVLQILVKIKDEQSNKETVMKEKLRKSNKIEHDLLKYSEKARLKLEFKTVEILIDESMENNMVETNEVCMKRIESVHNDKNTAVKLEQLVEVSLGDINPATKNKSNCSTKLKANTSEKLQNKSDSDSSTVTMNTDYVYDSRKRTKTAEKILGNNRHDKKSDRGHPTSAVNLFRDEIKASHTLKQTVLLYEAKIRQLTTEKSNLILASQNMKEHNKSFQKRHSTLALEFRQEKREIQFVKSQIGVMLSRIQSIPEKLTQLEAENENLRSEISDQEKTLTQRDQLFASERQINASLSEEIIKLETDYVNKDLMKNVCEEFEHLNEEYEVLKRTLDETEDKLFELAQDRDNLLKHSKILEEHLFKLKAENNYYHMLTANGILNSDSVNPNNSTGGHENGNAEFSNRVNQRNCSADQSEPEKVIYQRTCHDHHRCNRTKSASRPHRSCSSHRSPVVSSDSDSSGSRSSGSGSSSSSGGGGRRRRRHHGKSSRHHSSSRHHQSRHRASNHDYDRRSRHHGSGGGGSRHRRHKTKKDSATADSVPAAATDAALKNKNQNANVEDQMTFQMPKSRAELKELENVYDGLQAQKGKLESELSHVPINKGTSNTSNMTNLREQEILEDDLDKMDKQLASLRKILKQCKVFKSVP